MGQHKFPFGSQLKVHQPAWWRSSQMPVQKSADQASCWLPPMMMSSVFCWPKIIKSMDWKVQALTFTNLYPTLHYWDHYCTLWIPWVRFGTIQYQLVLPPPRVPHPWATGKDGAGRALAEGIDHMLHLSGIDQGLIMGPTWPGWSQSINPCRFGVTYV